MTLECKGRYDEKRESLDYFDLSLSVVKRRHSDCISSPVKDPSGASS
jgi:hypothetical protein